MDLNWIQRRMPEDARELRERLQRVLQMLAETVELKHEVIEGLRPSHLDNLGLTFAMRSHCREFSRRTGLPCELEVAEDFDDLDPAWSIALYRIAQETLTNITKHAHAQKVRITLKREPKGMRLSILDDGVGLPEGAAAKPKSHGIVGMRERVRQVGGTFTITPGPGGKGTLVEAFIPSVPEAESAPSVGEFLRTAS
jgi:signal transduction histidine kinase